MHLTGVPVKQRQIGSTGWIQVYTDKDLTYYYHELSWKGVWDCPRVVSEWIERQRKQSEFRERERKLLESRQDKLTEEQQLAQHAETIKDIVKELKIPPILTYDRAKTRLATHKDFITIPDDFKQRAFDLARKVQFKKTAPMTIGQDFVDRLAKLRQAGKIRHEHTVDDVLGTFFTDPKWMAVKSQLENLREVQRTLDLVYQETMQEQDRLVAECGRIISAFVEPYLIQELRSSDSEDVSQERIVEFARTVADPLQTPPEDIIESFKKYLQSNIAEATDLAVYGKVCAAESNDFVVDTLLAGWRLWLKEKTLTPAPSSAFDATPPPPLQTDDNINIISSD